MDSVNWRGARCASAPAKARRASAGSNGSVAPGQQWLATLRELRVSASPDLAALMAGAEALRNLAQ